MLTNKKLMWSIQRTTAPKVEDSSPSFTGGQQGLVNSVTHTQCWRCCLRARLKQNFILNSVKDWVKKREKKLTNYEWVTEHTMMWSCRRPKIKVSSSIFPGLLTLSLAFDCRYHWNAYYGSSASLHWHVQKLWVSLVRDFLSTNRRFFSPRLKRPSRTLVSLFLTKYNWFQELYVQVCSKYYNTRRKKHC